MSEGSAQVWSAGRRKTGTAAADRALQRETAPLRVPAPRPYRRQVMPLFPAGTPRPPPTPSLKVQRPSPGPRPPGTSRPSPDTPQIETGDQTETGYSVPRRPRPPAPPARAKCVAAAAAEAGLPSEPLPAGSAGRLGRKGLGWAGRPGSPSHGLVPGRGRRPGHRPAGPGAQHWGAWCRGPGTGSGLPRTPRPAPGAVPGGPAPGAPPLSAGPVALWPGQLITAAQ